MSERSSRPLRYRVEDGVYLIELDLGSIRQLFNSFDAAPFRERDLDGEAEEYIVGCTEEIPSRARLRLLLHLPAEEAHAALGIDVQAALANYFGYRRDATAHALRNLFAEGRASLVVGATFLAVCTTLSQVVRLAGEGWLTYPVSEGLIIAGWVAMWRPIQTFLYDWRPVRRRLRIHQRLAAMPVEVRARPVR